MDYPEARSLLKSLPARVKPGLDRINRLLDALDHPERTFPAVHVAGTNGKGSVVAMLSAVLSAAGYRVGRFTSPDLLDFRDRIEVNGNWIPKDCLAIGVERLHPLISSGNDLPTEFEVLTALAFSHFADEMVDIAVVEVGLGGRYDATNVVRSILSVLTNVGRDHTELLGTRLEEIAWEKAGIAKPGVPLLVGTIPPEAVPVVEEVAHNAGAQIAQVDIAVEEVSRDLTGAVYRIFGCDMPDEIAISLVGGYERENLRLALAAISRLRNMGWEISDAAIRTGLEKVFWPGRFEVVGKAPLIVLDGAHNPPGARALARDIECLFPNKDRCTLLFGILRDKEIDAVCDTLFPSFSRIVLTQSRSLRAVPAEDLLPFARKHGVEASVTGSVEAGLGEAQGGLNPDGALLVTGSLTVVKEARRSLVEKICAG